jgi:hypothetical protein
MKTLIISTLAFLTTISLSAQVDTSAALFKELKACDSLLFNVGYNTCDIRQFEAIVSDSFEFYHDEAGITSSKSAFIAGIRDGLCTLPYKAIRTLDESSLTVYPLKKKGVLYGAMQMGVHRFYARKEGKADRLTSTARFTHLWLLEAGLWKLSRSFSYDHH